MTIRRARADEDERLREIAAASKSHWDYEAEFVRQWAARIEFTHDDLYVAEIDGEIVAWAALVQKHGVWWLDDLWVVPDHIGRGIGTQLFDHIVAVARERGGPTRMEWQAEPNSFGFYEKLGARYVRDSEPTSWGRVLPVMGIDLS